MSKVTTTYDNTLKEKIFLIKGEEGYARSTDCVLTELYTHNGERQPDWNTSLDNMKLEFRINVLRDVGASQVVLYDNDTTIGVYDFDTNAHSIDLKYEGGDEDNRIELSYDVEHHLYAKYMGNKQCLKSQSQSYHLFEPMPDAFKCELSFIDADGFVMNGGTNSDYDMLDTIEFKVKLEAEDYISGNTIEVYDGNTLIGEYTTDANGLTELIQIETHDVETYTDFQGLKKLTARFRGTQYLEAKLTTTNVSVGYTVSVIEYPQYVVNSEPSQVIAKVESYNGNEPSAHMSMNYYAVFQIHRDEDPTGYEKISSSEQPNWDGMIYFDNVVFTKGEFCIRFAFPFSFDYVSDDYTTNVYDNVTVEVSPKQAITSANNVLPISATLKQGIAPLPEGIAVDFNGSSILTNANGIAVYNYEGNSIGDVSVTASVYSAYDTANIEDVYQYWSKTNGNFSIWYRDRYGATTSQSNGWKCTPWSLFYMTQLMSFEENITWEFVVKGVSKLTGIGEGNYPISGIKVGDVIKAVYDVETNYVTYIVNQTTIGSFQLHHRSSITFEFYFEDSTGYLTIDEVKIKRSA